MTTVIGEVRVDHNSGSGRGLKIGGELTFTASAKISAERQESGPTKGGKSRIFAAIK